MHFQTAFGVDVFDKITEREYKRWLKYIEVNGPFWWKRFDWNFANAIGYSGNVERNKTTRDLMIKFQRVTTNPLDNTIAIACAFGSMSPEEINELREMAEIYD